MGGLRYTYLSYRDVKEVELTDLKGIFSLTKTKLITGQRHLFSEQSKDARKVK